jgi:hypothetical protein
VVLLEELLGGVELPLELAPADWSVLLGAALEEELEPLLGVEGVALEDELESLLLGVEGAALELEELDESFLFRSTEPDMEPEGGVLVPEDEDEDPDGDEGAGVVVLEDDDPAEGRSARAPGPAGPLSQP